MLAVVNIIHNCMKYIQKWRHKRRKCVSKFPHVNLWQLKRTSLWHPSSEPTRPSIPGAVVSTAAVIRSSDISALFKCPSVPRAALYIPRKRRQTGIKTGDLGVHETSLSLPTEQTGNFPFKAAPTKLLRATGASTCWKTSIYSCSRWERTKFLSTPR
jgi:hypothetical protein